MKRVASSSAEVRRKTDRFRALRNDPGGVREFALGIIETEANPELLLAALRVLGENVRHEDGPLLRDLYQYFAESGRKRDSGCQLRSAVLGALWHLRDQDDLPLARWASRHREPSLNGNGEALRAAGLALLGVLDRDAAAYAAAHTLGTNDCSLMSGEPALTAVRLLANLGQTEALALFIAASDVGTLPDLVAEAFRGLVLVPAPHLHALIELYAPDPESNDRPRHLDDVALLGLCDLLIAIELNPVVARAIGQYLRSSSTDVYAALATSIVASRRTELVGLLLSSLGRETNQQRLTLALEALRHAPQTPEVEAAMATLRERTAQEPTLADLANTLDEDPEEDED